MRKFSLLISLLFVSVMGFAIDWSGYAWIGNGSGNAAYTDAMKIDLPSGFTVVNLQSSFGTEAGIYITTPSDIGLTCDLPAGKFATQGTGMLLYLSAFTLQETPVTVTSGGTDYVVTVFWKDGTTGGGTPLADPALSLNETAVTLDATVPETFQIVPTQSGDGAISYESSNTAIATVSNTGLVTAVGRGTATITVRTAETATYAADSETLEVTVNGPINWAALGWIGNGSGDAANTDKWKMAEHGYVNIQTPGFASEASIYAEFAAPIVYCSLGEGNYDIQGAGLCMHLSAFTAEVTEVLVIGNHIQSIFYVYKDGASGTANLNDIVPTNIYDTNLALETNGGWASATSGTAWQANDGNSGSSWESTHGVDAQMWTLDLGQRRIFNTIQLRWEGAYGKAFTIDVSNDGSAWTTVKSVNETLSGPFPYEQTLEFAEQTARFVRFNGIERGTQWGYNLFEFRVLLPGVSVLTSIDLSAAGAIAEVGGAGVALTAQPKDQNGQDMAETVSYEITPAAAGHMSGNTYIPDQLGAASIRAYNGTVYSSAVTVYGYEGANLALSTDMGTDNKVIAQSDYSPSGTDAFNAVDMNAESVYQGSATNGTAADAAARTFDSWFVLDLGGFYDINLVTIKFEGACSELYHVDFSEDNSTWNLGYNYVGSEGQNGHTDYLTTLTNNTKVQYVRFWSTKAATQWGMKIHDMKVFGTPWIDSGDTEAPVMVSASIDSKTWNTVTLAVSATDNIAVTGYRVVDAGHSIDLDLVATDGKITITGLTAETAYTFTVTAKDAAHLESTGIDVPVTTAVHQLTPLTAAPVPTWPDDQVKSLYSDSYAFAPESLVGYNQNWWDEPAMTEGNIGGNHYLDYDLYRNGMIGVQFAETSMATMEKIHIDIWASATGSVTFRPIIVDDGTLNDNRYTLNLVGGQWNSFDIDMDDFGAHNWTKVFQYSIENYNAGGLVGEHIAVDNVYFYRETPYVDAEAPTSVSASLLSTTYVSASIQVSATDNSGAVLYVVKNGDEVVANGGGASDATVTIDVPNLTPGTNYNLNVIAKDDAGNEAAPVAVAANTLALPAAAPTPDLTGKLTADIFCDAIAGGPAINIGGWGQSTVATSIPFSATDNVFYFRNFNYLGFELAPAVDATDLTYLHVDIYAPTMASVGITPISPGHELSTVQSLTPGEWTSLDIPLSTYASANIEWNNVFQFKFDQGDGSGELFVDNVYFWKAPDYTRDAMVVAGELGTICLPNNVALANASGANFFELAGKNAEGKIVFDQVTTELEAGVPYVFQATANEINIFYGSTHVDNPVDAGNGMYGTFSQVVLSGSELNDVYYFAQKALWSCADLIANSETLTIPANRAYIKLSEIPDATPTPAPGRIRLTMNVNGAPSVITGCEKIENSETPVKMMIDGQLFILRGEKLYDATGRLVK